MSSATLVSVAEYLSTSYRPDLDYVDGELQERNLGEWAHSRAQGRVFAYLFQREAAWGLRVVPEQRVQITPTRFRIPDVCAILASDFPTPILAKPPFLCVEILSSEDRVSRLNERIADYFQLGVRYVWVIDPLMGRAFVYTPGEMREVLDGMLRTSNPELLVPLDEVLKNE
ncbi:MAG: Uma2 family endonuclease [Acidobacteriaceae bacterium]|nr:Uma2 family endonuclease [Acidobacteriaceae bacterium]MBV9766571.1 Uma2 family endonuclease [Acidobacteriaceae bacterium]